VQPLSRSGAAVAQVISAAERLTLGRNTAQSEKIFGQLMALGID